MSRFTLAVLAAAITMLFSITSVAPAATLCEKAYGARMAVVKKHGKRAPGRNICRSGVVSRFSRAWTKEASTTQKATYLRALKRLLHPPQYLTAVGSPARPPAGTLSPRGALPTCTWAPESGGDYSAVNHDNPMRPAGKYQIITSTWIGHGGGKYAATADAATPAQQDEIAAAVLSRSGRGQWVNC